MKIMLTILLLTTTAMTGCVSSSARMMQQSETDMPHPGSQSLPVLSKDSTLDDYVKYALLNNPGLEAAFNEWEAAVERIPQAKSLPEPRFTYAYFIENVETRVGPQRQKFELSQMFPWFGTLGLKGDAAAEAARAAYENYNAAKLDLTFKLKSAYLEYFYLAKAISITEQNLQLMTELESVARSKFRSASAKHSSLVKAQVELGRLEDKLKALRALKEPLAAKLNALMNRSLNIEIPWPETVDSGAVEPLTASKLCKLLLNNSPKLKMLEHAAKKREIGTKLAKKGYFPDLIVGASIIDTGSAPNPDAVDSGKDPVMAMVGLSLPIWAGKNSAATREADALEQGALKRLENARNAMKADIAMALYAFQDAERKITLYLNTLIPKAQEAYEVNIKGFESDETDFLDVIDSERVLLEFELAHERAVADREKHLAQLEMLTAERLRTHPNPKAPLQTKTLNKGEQK